MLHRDLIRLRTSEPLLRAQRKDRLDVAILGAHAFVLRWFADDADDRLLIVNLGRALRLVPAPEPLFAPVAESGWSTRWSSEDPRYGGSGMAPLETERGWTPPGEAAVFLGPVALTRR